MNKDVQHMDPNLRPPEPLAPTWAKAAFGFAVAVVVGVVATIGWLDSHYATKSELRLIAKDVETIAKIEKKVDEIDEKITNLRVMIATMIKG